VNATGLKGYVFATADRSVLVMAVKGTSLDLFNMGGPTAEQDRLIVRRAMFVLFAGAAPGPC
jgi:putative lipase involved disintegration of autophagic bodies